MALSFRGLLAGAALAVTLGTTAASANPIYFFYSVNNGAFQLFGTADGAGATNFKSADSSYSISASASASPFLPAPNFNTTSNTVSTNTAMSVLVSIVETGLSTPGLSGFNVSFTNNNSTTPISMTFGTVSSAAGATPQQVASATINPLGLPVSNFYPDSNVPATYSVYQTYAATFGTGGGNFTATINESGVFPTVQTVPEPFSIALLGTGLIGVGLVRRKRA